MAEALHLRNLTDARGRRLEALVAGGRLRLRAGAVMGAAGGARVLDMGGGRLLRGLHDHHIHLMAWAAARASLDLSDLAAGAPALADRLRAASRLGPVRALGLDGAEALDGAALDRIVADVPVRVQGRTGGLWVLNRAALAELPGPPWPAAVERGADGRPSGRIWRGDGWLRRAGPVPDLRPLAAELARWGIVAVTDASVTTDQPQAETLAAAGLPQRLTLMSGGALQAGAGWQVGPLKLVPDERDLPSPRAMADLIALARRQGRCVAVHAVTHAELALTLAVLAQVGPGPGDRIEHGAMIADAAIPVIAGLGLTVVANPGFLVSRGDRYLRQIPAADLPDLGRLASLLRAGIPLAAGSDAPYGPANPWVAIRAACTRRTAAGAVIGPAEALDPASALALYRPEGGATEPADGDPADLVVLRPGARIGIDTDPVALTLIGGTPVYSRAAPAHQDPSPGVTA